MVDRNDEKTPLEAEILREVAEEIKEERYKALWNKIGPYVVGLIVAVLVATGGYEFYAHTQKQRALAQSEQLQTALAMLDTDDAESGAEILKSLVDSSDRGGYRWLAAFHYADYLIGQKKFDEAVSALDIVMNDKHAPAPFKNMAVFDKIVLRIENGDKNYADMEKDLDALAAKSDAWTPLALEMAAELALRQNDAEKAKSRWQQILGLSGVSEAKRRQVSEYISFVDEAAGGKASEKTEK